MPDLNFDSHNTLYATHGLHAYAAKCPPPLVKYAIRYYSNPGETVLDPMAGSGTTLVEARLMGRHARGYDIDPLACLIARVKTRFVGDARIEQAYVEIVRRAARDVAALKSANPPAAVKRRAAPPEFTNRDYWFSPEVANALAILAHHINHTAMASAPREFFWVAFSSLILSKTSVANARDIIHSRHHYHQHEEAPDVLGKFDARVKLMRKQMAEFGVRCAETAPTRGDARLGDARRLGLKDETIDLVFTSPPYVTALDYSRAHFLAVAWLQAALGVSLEGYLTKAADYVGSSRGRMPRDLQPDPRLTGFPVVSSAISQLSERSLPQAKRTQRYFLDMDRALGEIARALKDRRHAVIVVCPSHIRKVEVPTQEALVELGHGHGLRLKREYTRTISERRRILPYMRERFGKRMDTEYVLIFQKR
ncbi:MAG: DNA methyltransferase [Blastocatellia bacterium]